MERGTIQGRHYYLGLTVMNICLVLLCKNLKSKIFYEKVVTVSYHFHFNAYEVIGTTTLLLLPANIF